MVAPASILLKGSICLNYIRYYFLSEIHTGGKSKKVYISLARAAKVTDNAPRSCPQNGVTPMLHLFAGLDLHTGLLLLLDWLLCCSTKPSMVSMTQPTPGNRYLYPRDAFSARRGYGGGFNFLGVLLGGLSVAYAIVHSCRRICCLIWDRLMALPWCSYVAGGDYLEPGYLVLWFTCISSHTLIGAIIGIGLTNALMTGRQWWMHSISRKY